MKPNYVGAKTGHGLELAHRPASDLAGPGPEPAAPGPATLDTILGLEATRTVRSSTGFAAVRARAEGAATRLVGLSRLSEFQALIVNAGSRFRSFRDLRDRRIGRTTLSAAGNESRLATLRGVVTALEINGLTHRRVEWIDLPAGTETAALMDGAVDAIYVTGLRGIQFVRTTGARVIFNATDHRDRWVRAHTAMLGALTVEAQLQSQSREVVERDLDSLRTAGAWAAANSRQFLLQIETRFRTPAEDVLLAYGSDLHRRLTFDLTDEAMQTLDDFKRFLSRWGFIWTDFDVRGWAKPPV
jgi:ABC-type nitrate/sulfonate/bicarbonate transport system substrate-binding protein